MRSSNCLLLTAGFIFLSLSSKAQKSTDKYYDFGYDFFWNKKKYDSAFLMFNRYVTNPNDSLKKGSAYAYMGEIQLNIGDLYGAQESLTIATHTLDSLKKEHLEELGIAYNLLGNVSLNLKQYKEALEFYTKATTFFTATDYLIEAMNGRATAFQKMGKYQNAITIYDSILASKPVDQELVARLIDNSARTKWLQDSSYFPLPEFQFALKIRADSQYCLGLNASYAHISDYYSKLNPDSALWYAHKMLETAKANQSPDDILEAIHKIIMLNNASNVKEWYEEYKKLNDSLMMARDTTRTRFASIRYDVQEKQAENLRLQQKSTRQQVMIFGLVAIAVIIIFGLSILYNKRRKKIRQESETAIKNSKLKTSQKVHDVVANGLYGIMNELEHNKTIEIEPLINKIEGLYEKSRNISYEDIPAVNHSDHDIQIPHLLTSFANDKTKVILVGNKPAFWKKISVPQKYELQMVLNEIMVNMKKHSHAKNVVIHFRQENNKGLIRYKDDGTGFNAEYKFGNGLKNTVSRIKSINGEVNFGESGKEGVSITISFPLESDKL